MTPGAFGNAVKVCCATSGSTNLTLHFPAIAHELDYPFTLDDFKAISRATPSIMEIKPSDPGYLMEDYEAAGGLPGGNEIDGGPRRHGRNDCEREDACREPEGSTDKGRRSHTPPFEP